MLKTSGDNKWYSVCHLFSEKYENNENMCWGTEARLSVEAGFGQLQLQTEQSPADGMQEPLPPTSGGQA